MVQVVKQDSNQSGLRYAVESAPAVLPENPTWLPLEPNSYKNFGGTVKTKARMPISASRQLKKAVVVDLDADGGFEQDLTYTNFQDLSQCYFFAALRTKQELAVATVGGSNQFEPASGGDGFVANDLLFAKGFVESANNGLFEVSGTPTGSSITVSGSLTAATDESGIISRVGIVGASGQFSLTNSGTSYPTLNASGNAFATGVLTNSGGTDFGDGEEVVVGGKTYTLQMTLTNTDGHVKIGVNVAASLINLQNAINGSGGTPGTDYAGLTTPNTEVTAVASSTTLTATAKIAGTVGNSIATTTTAAHYAWGAGDLAGGLGRDLTTLGLIPGEFIFIGGDATSDQFATAANNGFARVRRVTYNAITLDKTASETVTDAGTSKTIRLYFGRVIKNESDPTLQIQRSVQIERTLGYTDTSEISEIQAEYLLNAIANEVQFNIKQADIVKLDLSFVANKPQFETSEEGVKPGTRPTLQDSDAFNATSDVAYSRMMVMGTEDAAPSPLFSFLTDLQITLKNNVKMNKSVAVLGAFSSTPGFFQVTGSVTAYFVDVNEMQSIIDNDNVTVEVHFVKANQGISMDLPLIVLAKGTADVKLNEPIMIPLSADASTATLIDQNLNHTMLMVFYDYLPDLALNPQVTSG